MNSGYPHVRVVCGNGVCYLVGMSKEKACVQVRVFPRTHKKLKVSAAKEKKTLADYIESLMLKK